MSSDLRGASSRRPKERAIHCACPSTAIADPFGTYADAPGTILVIKGRAKSQPGCITVLSVTQVSSVAQLLSQSRKIVAGVTFCRRNQGEHSRLPDQVGIRLRGSPSESCRCVHWAAS